MNHAIPIAITEALSLVLSRGAPSAIIGFTPAHGGCINHGGCLHTTSGDFFLKWNETAHLNRMFATEAKGLALLRATRAIYVPEVIATEDLGEYQYLLLEYVGQQAGRHDYWKILGQQLAAVHSVHASSSGLDHDNYIGSIPQPNDQCDSWPQFFERTRIAPLLQQAIAKGIAPPKWSSQFDKLFAKLPAILPNDAPSLLHGDLWTGNVIPNMLGAPCLIDPAVYYGHREVDLAMTRLFGEFDPSFYNAYQEAYPLQPGFKERVNIYNLYPLLVHLHLFGTTYITPIQSTLNAFT